MHLGPGPPFLKEALTMPDWWMLSYQLQLITPRKYAYLIQEHAFKKLLSTYIFYKFTSIIITNQIQNLNVKPKIMYSIINWTFYLNMLFIKTIGVWGLINCWKGLYWDYNYWLFGEYWVKPGRKRTKFGSEIKLNK